MRHDRRRFRRWASVAAVLLQVHLFLVLQFHHHGLDACRVIESAALTDGHAHAHAPEMPLLPCPACHVAEQGWVSPAQPETVLLLVPLIGEVPLPEAPHYASLLRSNLSGRDPPRS